MRYFTATAVLIGFAASASAADFATRKAPIEPPVAVTPWNWGGFYMGLNIGPHWETGSVEVGLINGALVDSVGKTAATQLSLGGQIGYRHQLPSNVVFGVQGSLEASSGYNLIFGGGAATMKTSGLGSASLAAQAGYAFGDFLPYIHAGVSYGSREGKLEIGQPVFFTQTANGAANGVFVGAGVDYRVWKNWFVSAEYKYTSWNSMKFNFDQWGVYFRDTSKTQDLLFGVNYKF